MTRDESRVIQALLLFIAGHLLVANKHLLDEEERVKSLAQFDQLVAAVTAVSGSKDLPC